MRTTDGFATKELNLWVAGSQEIYFALEIQVLSQKVIGDTLMSVPGG